MSNVDINVDRRMDRKSDAYCALLQAGAIKTMDTVAQCSLVHIYIFKIFFGLTESNRLTYGYHFYLWGELS